MYKGYEPEVSELSEGDVFTIEGFRYNKKGEPIFNCRKGRETEFILARDRNGNLVMKLYK